MDFTTVTTLDIPEGKVSSISYNGKVLWQCGVPLAEIAIGATVNIKENSGYVPYIVVAHDYIKTGTTTLLRRNPTSGSNFWASAPSSVYNNKYSMSSLEIAMSNYWAFYMPEETQALFQLVKVPVRDNANASCDAVTVNAYLFPLSTMEMTGDGSTKEGTYLPYFSSGYSIAASESYWTRSVTGGMAGYARAINTSGEVSSVSVTNSRALRPAGCIPYDTLVVKQGGSYYIL